MNDKMTLGETLKEKREKLSLTLEEIAAKMRVKKNHLLMIENDQLEQISGKVYVNGMVKSYGNFLGVDDDFIKKELQKLPSNIANQRHQLINLDQQERIMPDRKMFFGGLMVFCALQMIVLIIHYFTTVEPISSNLIINHLIK